MDNLVFILLYALPLVAGLGIYLWRRSRREFHYTERLAEAVRAGLTEPPTLHPVIDPRRCLGAGSCVKACPEKALGFIGGKGVLVNAAACIGHGACQASCPHDAIQLVFGTEKRGVDIPMVKPNFETNVPGLFIAGELGGMGLIRKAVEQGRQAMESIAALKGARQPLDVAIVGAGPAGLAAALTATEKKLRYVLLEQEDSLGGTVYHYPRNKLVMTAPVKLPIVGQVNMSEISKENLLKFWQGVVTKTGLSIRYRERMESLSRDGDGFVVKTARGEHRARAVLLTIGRRGTPRKLGVPGEEQAKVVYRLVDAEQYRGHHVLVVGGGDAALEAAIACAGQPGTAVALSYRSETFSRVKQKNRDGLKTAEDAGRLKVLLQSTVKAIGGDSVTLDHAGKAVTLKNNAVIVCAGGVLPTPFLKEIGIQVETKYGTA